jgi:LacI family transcriptional regulator
LKKTNTKYSNITQDIVNKIVCGEFGDMLPPLSDLARYYGVNIKTVQKGVASLRADGFLDSVAGFGTFVRNREALVGMKSYRIGLIVGCAKSETSYYSSIGEHITSLAGEFNCSVIYRIAIHNSSESFKSSMENLNKSNVDGFIVGPGVFNLSDTEIKAMAALRPVVLFSGSDGVCDNVVVESQTGMEQLLNLFIDYGHERIVCLRSSLTDDRHSVYQKVLKCRSIPFSDELVVPCLGDQFTAFDAMSEFMARKIAFSAVFAHNDSCAFGAYFAIRNAGLNVPADVSISGIDDIYACEKMNPPLTTISMVPEKVARISLELIHGRLAGERAGALPSVVRVQGKPVIRTSLGVCRTRQFPGTRTIY